MLHEFRVDKSLVQINNLIDLAVPDQGTKITNKGRKRSLNFKKVAFNQEQLVKNYLFLNYICYHLCQLLQGDTEISLQERRIIVHLFIHVEKNMLSNYLVFGTRCLKFGSLENPSQGFCVSLLLRMCSQSKLKKSQEGSRILSPEVSLCVKKQKLRVKCFLWKLQF